jgi:hypothetical protein
MKQDSGTSQLKNICLFLCELHLLQTESQESRQQATPETVRS